MDFMSPEHVAVMNELLASSPEVRTQGALLDRDYVLAYRLSDGPGGETVHWTMTMGPTGMVFGLEEVASADAVFVTSWPAMIGATIASKDGQEFDPGITIEGDPEVVAITAGVFAAGQAVAAVQTTMPDLT